ncbi:TPA: DedA family protein [Vibrio parahaemolyticus]
MEQLQHIIDNLSPILNEYGYAILFAGVFLEGTAIPVPGQSLMIAASCLAVTSVFDLKLVMLISLLSAFFGNLLGYYIGLNFSNFFKKKGGLSSPTVRKLRYLLNRNPILIFILSRFMGPIKEITPISCGIFNVSTKDFLIGNFFGSLLWVLFYCLLFYLAFSGTLLLSN